MIVSINKNNSDSYLNLFTDAYRFLKAIDEKQGTNYVNPDQERFSSLAEYYGHMADLFDTFAYQYTMVPLDEEPFEIKLNERKINVPASFSKCASVQTDLLAETIIFTADRYFDYMDLANTEIFIQWITPDGTHGATRVEMIDRTGEDMLKFAWPLNDAITKTPGKVKFSVRFFRLDKDSDEIVYSLNTTDAEITIQPALQPEGPSIVENPVEDNAFKKAIINSYYSSVGIPQPQTPSYQEPGSNITINPENLEDLKADDNNVINNVKVVGLKDNTVTLYAQAIVPDAGEIRYEWYYKPIGSEVSYPCAAFPVEDGDPVVFGTAKDVYLEVKEEDKQERIPHERYYVQDGSGYILFTEDFPTTETLYTKFTAYTVAEGDVDITGTYHVRAYNEVPKPNSNEVITSIHYGASNDCLLPAPKDIEITTNLADGMILVPAADGVLNEATLTLAVAADEYNPEVSYEWRMSATSADDVLDAEVVADATTAVPTYTVHEPGWYSARVLSTLNRKENNQFSAVCKVTEKPLPPVVTYQGYETLYLSDGPATLDVEAQIANPSEMAVGLLSDAIHYVWQIRPIDALNSSNWITIADGDAGISGQGTATLVVTDAMPYAAANFRCLVINELNGQKAIFDHSGTYADNMDPALGEFKNEPPYIFDSNKKYTYAVLK